jgi:hypothetical protein
MSGDDATEDSALMANRFKETVKTVAKKTLPLTVEIWPKFLGHWMQPGTKP